MISASTQTTKGLDLRADEVVDDDGDDIVFAAVADLETRNEGLGAKAVVDVIDRDSESNSSRRVVSITFSTRTVESLLLRYKPDRTTSMVSLFCLLFRLMKYYCV